ncbi:MAG: DUF952 domain-containing protein [Pyrinomonadaceae bacterium]|nr:DUF952 domain-containing protein [Pyrinomonadaceae bacterium]
MRIFHIVLPADWSAFDGLEYSAASLRDEGFIHCSYKHQLDTVIQRYYAGEKELVILELDRERLERKLVEEPSTGGEIYPHIYGTISRDEIVKVERWAR